MVTPKKVLLEFTEAKVLAEMKPGIAHPCFTLAEKFGCSTSDMRELMHRLEIEGKVDDALSRCRGRAYQLKDRKVAPPYVNLHLTEDLLGYDKTLRSREKLAMTIRR